MVRLGVVAAIWFLAGSPMVLRWLSNRRRHRDGYQEVLTRVVERGALRELSSDRRQARRPADAPMWPLPVLALVAVSGTLLGSRPLVVVAVLSLNGLTVLQAHRSRMRAVRASGHRPRRPTV